MQKTLIACEKRQVERAMQQAHKWKLQSAVVGSGCHKGKMLLALTMAFSFAATDPIGSSERPDPVFGYPVVDVCDLDLDSVMSCENTRVASR